jgi:hypothetical protein
MLRALAHMPPKHFDLGFPGAHPASIAHSVRAVSLQWRLGRRAFDPSSSCAATKVPTRLAASGLGNIASERSMAIHGFAP